VRESDCANALNLSDNPHDNIPAVLATTRMIALMELVGARLIQPFLQPVEMSVGAHVDVSHTAATPIGATVTATATYRGRDGKLFVFEVVAHDPAGKIGTGRTNAQLFPAIAFSPALRSEGRTIRLSSTC
jgi:fluoroacetyl-CoA thioesterase